MRHFSLPAVLLLLSCAVFANQTIKGTVANESGKPVSGAQVILLRSYPEEAGTEIGRAVSDASGGFSIACDDAPLSSLPASTHIVASAGSSLGIQTVGNPRVTQRIVLSPRTSVSGIVEGEKADPIAVASVVPDVLTHSAYFGTEQLDYRRIMPALGVKPAVTDAKGKFVIGDLPSDWDVTFRAAKDGYDAGTGSSKIILKQAVAPALGWITGKIDGLSAAGIRVTAAAIEWPEGTRRTAFTKPDGSFAFDALPSGTYTVFVLESDKPVQPVQGVKVNASQTSEVKLVAVDGTPVQGTVVDRRTGTGIAGVMVISPGSKPVLSGSDGGFSLHSLPGPGILSAVGRPQGYRDLQQELDIPETGEVTGVKLQLSPAAKIEGRVTESGKAVEAALIRLITESGPIDSAESNPDGSYSFVEENQPELGYLVAYDPATRWVAINSAPGEIALEPPATLTGVVKDSSGNPIPNAKFTPMLLVAHLKIYALHSQTRSDANGKFTITGLIPAASYAFRIEAAGFKDGANTTDAKLISGKTATTVFLLERAHK